MLGKDIAFYGAVDFAFRLLGFAVFPIYAHVFTVKEFGVYALVSATIGIIALFANLGMNNATQRFYWDPDTEPGMRPTLVSTGLGVLLVWSTILVLVLAASLYPLREPIAARYGITWTIALVALATIVPEQVLQYCLDTLRLQFTPWKFALVSLLKHLVGVVAGLVLILGFDGGLEGLFLGALVGALASVPIALILIRRDLELNFSAETARRLFSFGYPFIFAGLAYWIFGTADRWMLVELSDATQLGLFAIAYKFAVAVLFLNTAFGQAWSPAAHKIRREDAQYRSTYARIFSLWFFFSVLVGSTVALFGPEALRLLTPADYWAAAPALGLLVMGIVLSGTTQITAVGISIALRPRLLVYAAWITAIANVLLNFALIPAWGAGGAALATFLSYGMLTTMYLRWSQNLHPIPLEKTKLLYCAALVVAVAGASIALGTLEPSAPLFLGKIATIALMLAGGIVLGIVDMTAIRGAFAERLKT